MQRFIVATARISALAGVVLSTLAGAVFAPFGPMIVLGVIGAMLAGAIAGFIFSSLCAAILFTQIEIANNTRRSLQLLEQSAGSEGPRQFRFKNGEALSGAAKAALRDARGAGYRVTMSDDGEIEITGRDIEPFVCASSSDIAQFSVWLKRKS
ncbi:hypothetical protein C2U70_23855 [Bradyrhizobium guangdongense]|uniref:hypothetical protein n=1 Tax=Bradyrhizobium guangdongense TaxID=1325090 RepID=UPI0011278AD9|nr:hypothetical protein [Bradyrhizobium guangdongense]TPQ31536.1 hypothetical protein C2U70_23855 [Bradyrhizobium guangdongense]